MAIRAFSMRTLSPASAALRALSRAVQNFLYKNHEEWRINQVAIEAHETAERLANLAMNDNAN
jgi:hypothetical protein